MILLLARTASAEGFEVNNPEAYLSADTFIYVDILDTTDEVIYWEGTGSVSVTAPDGGGPYSVPSGSFLASSLVDTAGTWTVQLTNDQYDGFDVGVMDLGKPIGASFEKLEGRVHSDHWYIQAISDTVTISGNFYVPVPLPDSSESVVFNVYLSEMAGSAFELMANQQGGSDIPGWSIPDSGTAPASELQIYFAPPEAVSIGYLAPPSTPILAVKTDTDFCDAVLPGYSKAQITLTGDADGATLFGCRLEGGGSFSYSGGDDYTRYRRSFANAAEEWDLDGFDQHGDVLEPGDYTCGARLLGAPMHFLIHGASTLYPGIGMGQYSSSGVSARYMQWNDSLLTREMSTADVLYGSSDPPLEASPESGILTGYPQEPDVNAHGWGDFANPSRGDEGWSNTWTFADVSDVETFDLTILSTEDEDADSLLTGFEECRLGTSPTSNDTDGDQLGDKDEVGSDIYNPLNTDGDSLIDALDEDDDNDGLDTLKEVIDTDSTGVPWDVDGDGANNWHDTDADGDGKLDADELTDNDGDGIVDYLDPYDDPIDEPGDSGEPTGGDTGAAATPTLTGTFAGGACRCSAAPFSAVLWPLLVALLARRRR